MSKTNQETREISKHVFCLSYGVLVCAYEKSRRIFFVTSKKWSKTTSCHINEFLKTQGPNFPGYQIVQCGQDQLEIVHQRYLSELYATQMEK